MDVHDSATRSYNMSRIRSKDMKPEMLVRRFLHSRGLRFKLHDRKLPGKPDIVLPKYKTVIDVRGCFWHGHEGCRYFVIPKTRREFWEEKINSNRLRDSMNDDHLKILGWKVLVIWECELKNKEEETLEAIQNELKSMIC